MSWFQFLGAIAAIYVLYYLLLLVYDKRTGVRSEAGTGMQELTFDDEQPPEKVSLEDFLVDVPFQISAEQPAVSAVTGLGGVNLKGLFELARNEAIEYTRSVSF